MKFSHINAGRWDEKLESGMKSSVLRTCQIKNNKKPNPCWRQAPITIVIVGNHGLLEGGMKLLEGEMKLYMLTNADFIPPDNSQPGRCDSFSHINRPL